MSKRALAVIDPSSLRAHCWSKLLAAQCAISVHTEPGVTEVPMLIVMPPQCPLPLSLGDVPVMWLASAHNVSKLTHEHPYSDRMLMPVRPDILVARVTAWLDRWYASQARSWVMIAPNTYWDAMVKTVLHEGQSCTLTEKENALLMCLSQRPDVWRREDLLAEIWRYDSRVETRTLESHIHRLRKKIESIGANPSIIQTQDDGYRLVIPSESACNH